MTESKASFHLLDHDKKIYDEVDKTKEPTEQEYEDDVNVRLNTQIIATKLKIAEKLEFKRAKSGFWGFRSDRNEDVEGYSTEVYHVDGLHLVTKIRSEHLPENTDSALKKTLLRVSSSGTLGHSDSNASLSTPQQNEETEENIDEIIKETKMEVYKHRDSLEPPLEPSLEFHEYFTPVDEQDASYVHLNRPMQMTTKDKAISATVWMADSFPLTIKQFLPVLSLLSPSNEHFERLQEFIELTLPSGFPVQIGEFFFISRNSDIFSALCQSHLFSFL